MIDAQPQVGVLLINLGTPAGPDIRSVRGYLAEFLSDPHVIDLPAPLRQLLVYGVILPFRPKVSAHAYRQIWTKEGSPLLLYSQQLVHSLGIALGDAFAVELGMRYGKPDIATALRRLRERGCQKLLIMPLFPQYSSAATGSALKKTLAELQKNADIPSISCINSFFDHPGFIEAWRSLITRHTPTEEPEMWIFSYHGLPVRHLDKGGCATSECLARGDCAKADDNNYLCYRRQCFTTSRLLAEALGLPPSRYRVSFQSRLGRTPWITPYTDHLLTELAAQGIKRIAIVCPSFCSGLSGNPGRNRHPRPRAMARPGRGSFSSFPLPERRW